MTIFTEPTEVMTLIFLQETTFTDGCFTIVKIVCAQMKHICAYNSKKKLLLFPTPPQSACWEKTQNLKICIKSFFLRSAAYYGSSTRLAKHLYKQTVYIGINWYCSFFKQISKEVTNDKDWYTTFMRRSKMSLIFIYFIFRASPTLVCTTELAKICSE